jgi:hypothetical protein
MLFDEIEQNLFGYRILKRKKINRGRQCFGSESGSALNPHSMGPGSGSRREKIIPKTEGKKSEDQKN